MVNNKARKRFEGQSLKPISNKMQMGARVYQALLNSIVSGQFEPGTPLRPDVIARQLEVSTTPVRESMHRLESDGLVVKVPYQGWFVREFTNEQIQELYEVRAALECLGVRLACERITDAEVDWLRNHQLVGEAALASGDKEAYRIYNQDLHAAILKAARNFHLSSMMDQLGLQNEVLMVKSVRIAGRALRAFEEHRLLIELIAQRQVKAAEQLMQTHILEALKDLIRLEGSRAATREYESAESTLVAKNLLI
jgi:DNA-binding GntR family transcriptional regulator